MSTKKPEALFYITVKDIKTRPNYRTKTITIYRNGVPIKLEKFVPWLTKTIEEKIKGGITR